MNDRVYSLFGIVGPLLAYVCIGVSIALSSWFTWQSSALSDLGHSIKSDVASIFNIGLLSAGFLVMIFAITVFRKHAKYTSVWMLLSAFSLQLVATFDEVYGFLHFTVSVLLFSCFGVTSIVYALEKKSRLAVIVFIVSLVSWSVYGMNIFVIGVAVPETMSSIARVCLMPLLMALNPQSCGLLRRDKSELNYFQ